MTKKVTTCSDQNGIILVYIPPRLTNLLQPADVVWFASIKKSYKSLWTQWYIHGEHSYTRNNNMRSPGYNQCLKWLVEIWANFDPNLICQSFENCGIRANDIIDGRLMLEMEKIHSMLATSNWKKQMIK